MGLDIEGNIPAEHALIYHGRKREVGHITAALWSPTAKRNIALALLSAPIMRNESGDLWAEIYAVRELEYEKMMVSRVRCRGRSSTRRRRRATPPGLF